MFSLLARRLAYFFAEKNIIRTEDKEIYAYGYEILLSETVNWIITGIIALFAGKIAETIVYIISFMRLRETIGGFHARTHIGCIVISNVVYIVCLYIISKTPAGICWLLIIAGLAVHMVLVAAIAPVAHPNKPFADRTEGLKFRKKSLSLSSLYVGICVILLLIPFCALNIYSWCIVLGMLSASISMLVEYIRQKIILRKEKEV